eukprot:Sdes_comp18190_c0_seq3m7720
MWLLGVFLLMFQIERLLGKLLEGKKFNSETPLLGSNQKESNLINEEVENQNKAPSPSTSSVSSASVDPEENLNLLSDKELKKKKKRMEKSFTSNQVKVGD